MSGEAVVAQRGIRWTGRTTGNNNKEDATIDTEKRTKSKDQKEEVETAKKGNERKTTIQKKALRERENPTTKQPTIRRETEKRKR